MTAQAIITPLKQGKMPAVHHIGDGPQVLFHHATGLGPRCYASFLSELAPDFSPTALMMRPLWPDGPAPDRKREWDVFADDMIAWIEANGSAPVLAVGHSIGAATTAMAAVKRPDLFKGLVLLEPAGVTARIKFLLRLIPYMMRSTRGPAAEVLNGPTSWPGIDAAFADYRNSRAYRRFDDQKLRTLIEALTVPKEDGGIRLEYPRDWEAHLYATPPYILPTLKKLTVPTRIITGKPSLFMDPSIAQALHIARPDLPFTSLTDYGHLLPLEAPAEVGRATREALASLM